MCRCSSFMRESAWSGPAILSGHHQALCHIQSFPRSIHLPTFAQLAVSCLAYPSSQAYSSSQLSPNSLWGVFPVLKHPALCPLPGLANSRRCSKCFLIGRMGGEAPGVSSFEGFQNLSSPSRGTAVAGHWLPGRDSFLSVPCFQRTSFSSLGNEQKWPLSPKCPHVLSGPQFSWRFNAGAVLGPCLPLWANELSYSPHC